MNDARAEVIKAGREADHLERVAERTRIQVRRDLERGKVRLDLVADFEGKDTTLARVYLSSERAHSLMAAIGRAALEHGAAR